MVENLVVLIMGWPGILIANAAAIGALALRNWRLMLFSALLALPFAFYLFAHPGSRFAAPLVVLSLLIAAWFTRRDNHAAAWIFIMPLPGLTLYLAVLVLTQ